MCRYVESINYAFITTLIDRNVFLLMSEFDLISTLHMHQSDFPVIALKIFCLLFPEALITNFLYF